MGNLPSDGNELPQFKRVFQLMHQELGFTIELMSLFDVRKKILKYKNIDEEASLQFHNMFFYALEGKVDEAIEIGELIKLKHQFIGVYLLQATCYKIQNRFEDAENCYKQVVQLKPKKLQALFGLFDLCMKKRDYENALNYINEIKKVKNSPDFDHLEGIIYQEMNEHEKAIQCFEIAHQVLPSPKYFVSKMKSYMVLEKFEEAYECCQIASIYEPNNKFLLEKQQYLMQQLGIEEEQKQMIQLKIQQEHNYNLETYKEKKKLEAQQTQLIKRQSKIKIKPDQSKINQTQSQIQVNKQKQQIMYYLDAIYYTFTQFFVEYIHAYQNSSAKIATHLSTKQNIKLSNFTDLIRITIQKFYPDLKDLSVYEISNKLIQWHNKKIQAEDIFQHLHQIFQNIIECNYKQQLIEILNEDFSKSIERKEKNKDFYLYVSQISHEFEKEGYAIYRESGGLLGLEHAIQILGFIIQFTDLVDDDESFENIIFRGLSKYDFSQYFQSQSRIKKQTQQLNQQSENLEEDEEFLGYFRSSIEKN